MNSDPESESYPSKGQGNLPLIVLMPLKTWICALFLNDLPFPTGRFLYVFNNRSMVEGEICTSFFRSIGKSASKPSLTKLSMATPICGCIRFELIQSRSSQTFARTIASKRSYFRLLGREIFPCLCLYNPRKTAIEYFLLYPVVLVNSSRIDFFSAFKAFLFISAF